MQRITVFRENLLNHPAGSVLPEQLHRTAPINVRSLESAGTDLLDKVFCGDTAQLGEFLGHDYDVNESTLTRLEAFGAPFLDFLLNYQSAKQLPNLFLAEASLTIHLPDNPVDLFPFLLFPLEAGGGDPAGYAATGVVTGTPLRYLLLR